MRRATATLRHHVVHQVRRGGWLLVILYCFGLTVNAQTDSSEAIEPLERVMAVTRRLVLDTLGAAQADAQININQLDSRLRLPRCAELPQAQLAPGSRSVDHGTVNVRCSAPVAWSILVPVRVVREQMVVVTNRALPRQHILQAEDVRLKSVSSVNLTNGYFDALSPVLGLQIKRALAADWVLNPTVLTQPKVVKRGQQVTLFSTRPGLTVQMKGEALEDGVVGQRIRVRNRTSKQIIEGYVESSGAIRLGL